MTRGPMTTSSSSSRPSSHGDEDPRPVNGRGRYGEGMKKEQFIRRSDGPLAPANYKNCHVAEQIGSSLSGLTAKAPVGPTSS